ncbi:MAG: Xaa-Pro peptidase family protein [Verrucomicrobia bacterium]|nr:Xaa-Pro peptidase family protein [Verrucomicrobiota bacterium]MBU4248516.1 Xaa-Pro peptidase family protein [Verrucomicrobiota bacterium]MBU4292148.1 Xaa-Pro peptidase family protein [Verrucomicrobiota bacterium]MBU4497337.1 Xaa-Pro peptidase family protein [Verrucomicrobiota bacterium]MCG2680269.1 Xaa-Pro peptidase family protein [Kiritimatiellia bacterium]
MGYLPKEESMRRIAKVRSLLEKSNLDVVFVYYDEINIGNGWYLTGWCPQFESGMVVVPRQGNCLLLGGPESEPFARLDSAITETRNFPVFMVPDEEYPNAIIIDFPALFAELNRMLGKVKGVGLVGGGRMPADCHRQIAKGFAGTKLVDLTDEYVRLRYDKSPWEIEQIRSAFAIADKCYQAMKTSVRPGISEIKVAAEGEYAARRRGASGFGFSAIVGSGRRSNAVVPTAGSKTLVAGETVMIGLAPKVQGYAGVIGDTLPVSGAYTPRQKHFIKILAEAFKLTRAQLKPGRIGKDIDAPARAFFKQQNLSAYLVCPFVHTIGLHEAEAPFFGPHSRDVLKPGMTVCVDVSLFGHPEINGARIETGYEITAKGPVPLSPAMDRHFMKDLG